MKIPILGLRRHSLVGKKSPVVGTPKSQNPVSSKLSTESGNTGLDVSFDDSQPSLQQPASKEPTRSRSFRLLLRSGTRSLPLKPKKNEVEAKSSTSRTGSSHVCGIATPVDPRTNDSGIFGDYSPQYQGWTKVNPFHSTSSSFAHQDSVLVDDQSLSNVPSTASTLSSLDSFGDERDTESHGTSDNVSHYDRTEEDQAKIVHGVIQSLRKQALFADDDSSISTINSVAVEYTYAENDFLGVASTIAVAPPANRCATSNSEEISTLTSVVTGATTDVHFDASMSEDAIAFENASAGDETITTIMTGVDESNKVSRLLSTRSFGNNDTVSKTTRTTKGSHLSDATSAFTFATLDDAYSTFSLPTNEQVGKKASSTCTPDSDSSETQPRIQPRQSRRRSNRDQYLLLEVIQDIRSLAEDVVTGEDERYKEWICTREEQCFSSW